MNANDPRQDPTGAEDARLTSLEERLKVAHQAEEVRTGKAIGPAPFTAQLPLML